MLSSDCFICAIRPVFYICRFNIFTANFFCPHSTFALHPYFQKSKLLSKCALACIAFLAFETYVIFADLKTMTFNKVLSNLMIMVTNVTIIIMIIQNQFNLNALVDHANGILHILLNKDRYGVENFLGPQFQKTLYLLCYKNYTPFMIISIILILNELANYQNVTVKSFLRLVNLLVNTYTNLSLMCNILLLVEIYRTLLNRCHEQMQTVLDLASNSTKRNFSIRKDLQKLQQLRTHIYENFEKVQVVCGSNLIVFWCCGCTVLVMNFFLLVDGIKQSRVPDYDEILLFILYCLGCVGAYLAGMKVQKLYEMVRNVKN